MPNEDAIQDFHAGFVGLAGRPNVGKSTLINRFLGQSVAPVSPRPQTTRQRQLGILTLPHAQIIFIDTPGLHRPHHRLGDYMNDQAEAALNDVDLILVIFDVSQVPHLDDFKVVAAIEALEGPRPILVGLNKADLLTEDELKENTRLYQDLLGGELILPISATRGDGTDDLLERIIGRLPRGPQYYPEGEITDRTEREIAADLIRAAGLRLLRDEVPHAIAVRIDRFKERNDHGAYIAATIFVERKSQKGIVIGKGGAMIREIGTLARTEIEGMAGRKVYLELRVKVLAKWRNDRAALARLGYDVMVE
jgi:GTP-binding protein Era